MSPTFRYWIPWKHKGTLLLPVGVYGLLMLGISLCVASFAYAHTGATGSSWTTGTATTVKTTGTGHKAGAAKPYKGEIRSVDATAETLVVHLAKGADITLKVNDYTKWTPGKNDLKAGAKIRGTYKTDGTDNWAITVDCKTCGDTGHGKWP